LALPSPHPCELSPATDARMRSIALLLCLTAVHSFSMNTMMRFSRPAVARATVARSFGKRVRKRRSATVMEVEGPVRVRFAPSPTGSLHVGGARTALYNWLKARQSGGKFVIRIEDTDTARSTRESEESMLEDLRWLGLDWDEGPGVDGPCAPYRQSERGEIYAKMGKQLMDAGKAYPCFQTEEEIERQRAECEAKDEPYMYDNEWRDADPAEVAKRMEAGDPYCVRFKVEPGTTVAIDDLVRGHVSWDAAATVGDFILLRSSGVPVYNFCVAVDDALMGITHVVRAEEHLTNTLRQGLILAALDMAMPTYAHASLILGEDRSKLSKRHGATSVDQFRQQGFLREAMINYLVGLGWNDGTDKEIYSVPEVVEAFGLDRIVKTPSMFDMAKLKWVNGQHIRALDRGNLGAMLAPFLQDVLAEGVASPSDEFLGLVVDNAQEKIELLTDAQAVVEEVAGFQLLDAMASGVADAFLEDGFEDLVSALVKAYDAGEMPTGAEEDFDEAWKGFVKKIGKETERKGKRLFQPVRLAVTGAMSGSDIGAQLKLVAAAKGQLRGGLVVPLEERIEILRTWAASQQ